MLQALQNIFGAFRYELQSIPKYERYQCGQVWSYKTRANEADSKLSIVRIDKAKTGDIIFHVWLDNLNVKNPNHPDGIIHELPHTPLTVAAINCSVRRLIETTADLPDQSEGYAVWLQAWKQGKASIFSQSVREILDFVERSLCAGDEKQS